MCSGDEESEDSDDVGSGTDDSDDVAELKAHAHKTFLKLALAGPATVMEKPAAGGGPGNGKPPLWQNEYFWVSDGPSEFIHAKVRAQWKVGPSGMGSAASTPATTTVWM